MNYLVPLIVFVFGAVIGSFLNVCIYRIPRSKSIVKPNSFCPNCEKPIEFYDNIPIVSYILLGGKCRYCENKISKRYPFIELLTGALFLMFYTKLGLTLELFVTLLFVILLIVIAFIDLEFQIIPDVLSIGGLVAGLVLAVFRPMFLHLGPKFGFLDALYGVLIGGGVLFVIAYGYQLITKREGMGGGDIKLLAMIGAFIGIKGGVFSLVAGSLLGTIVGIPLMLAKKQDTKYAIPFGPFLSLGALMFLFSGDRLIYGFLNIIMRK
jgi:leader peptidase (prepilin peptidase) / N-methyltransferase